MRDVDLLNRDLGGLPGLGRTSNRVFWRERVRIRFRYIYCFMTLMFGCPNPCSRKMSPSRTNNCLFLMPHRKWSFNNNIKTRDAQSSIYKEVGRMWTRVIFSIEQCARQPDWTRLAEPVSVPTYCCWSWITSQWSNWFAQCVSLVLKLNTLWSRVSFLFVTKAE